MLHAVFLFALLAAPFWESKPAHDWSDRELTEMLTNSPWARPATAGGLMRSPGVPTYLSSALPMQEAEAEVRRRRQIRNRSTGPPETNEYLEYLKEQKGESIVLTVLLDPDQLADNKEARRMEEECVMKVGRKKYKLKGHFPPAPGDPYLRLVFPRAIQPNDKVIEFDLYVPGATDPYRTAEYVIKELTYKGSPQF